MLVRYTIADKTGSEWTILDSGQRTMCCYFAIQQRNKMRSTAILLLVLVAHMPIKRALPEKGDTRESH